MSAKNGSIKLVAGNSNPALAQEIANWLHLPLTKASVRRFADNEIFVEILENVRGSDVYIIQSTSFPANDHLMELLIITDALRRSSARRITAVIPYFGYARQDRKVGSRAPISAKLVANLITHAGVDRVMTLDLHAAQIQGFFDIPTDNLYASPVTRSELCSPTWRRSPALPRRSRSRTRALTPCSSPRRSTGSTPSRRAPRSRACCGRAVPWVWYGTSATGRCRGSPTWIGCSTGRPTSSPAPAT